LALRSPHSGCFVDAGKWWVGGGGGRREAPKTIKPFSHIAERRVFVVASMRKTRREYFPLHNGRKLKKSAFNELHEYYRELMG
jgi:hypothetical protein